MVSRGCDSLPSPCPAPSRHRLLGAACHIEPYPFLLAERPLSLRTFSTGLQDADLMEEQEQVELIEQLERAAGRQRHYTKSLLLALGVLLVLLYLSFAGHQMLHPWQALLHARFRGRLRQAAVAAAELCGAAMAGLATAAVLCFPGRSGGGWQAPLAAGALLAGLQVLFWSVAIYRVMQAEHAGLVGSRGRVGSPRAPALLHPLPARFARHVLARNTALKLCILAPCRCLLLQGDVWRLLWLPVAPPVFVALLGAAIGGMRGTEADLARLRAARYIYKRA